MSDVNRPQRFRFNSNLELLQNVRHAAGSVITRHPVVREVSIEFGFRENKQRTENEEKKQSYSNPTAEGDNRCHVSHPKRAQIHFQITISIHFVDAAAEDASSVSFVTLLELFAVIISNSRNSCRIAVIWLDFCSSSSMGSAAAAAAGSNNTIRRLWMVVFEHQITCIYGPIMDADIRESAI